MCIPCVPFGTESCVCLGWHVDIGNSTAAIAQLGERQAEDLKGPGSVPGLGMRFFFMSIFIICIIFSFIFIATAFFFSIFFLVFFCFFFCIFFRSFFDCERSMSLEMPTCAMSWGVGFLCCGAAKWAAADVSSMAKIADGK